ncbi:Uncharacterized protein MJ0202 [Halanaerobium saccharolyticum subsp. saccharolyticum DSM 6643]|uniref:Uncharacterized protein MJ0202 n=1 Tax=Halanaerobium saccharolyticum subsp. saccharolyticum DSM 6643 TaxID=1293054 RepID=M5DZ72_9FIRM|nr:ARMT1-like domain-containing protein [Halanaerobium saccharolyticum]CCU78583.1 Uncharacterized protein MJ0202 [Halanaerobium saccharolyticum subsp. saccharolyticum DSM 6643]
MKIKYGCYPCILRQSIESAEMIEVNEKEMKQIIKHFGEILTPALENDFTAPMLAAEIQKYIKNLTEVEDPYFDLKEKNLKEAQRLLPLVEAEIKKAEDSLLASLLMSAMGNSIDAGVSLNVNIKENIDQAIKDSFAHSDYKCFKEKIKKADSLLIIADNTGEALFDRLLLKELKPYNLNITYAVREIPILNDITAEKAAELGIGEYAEIIKSGTTAPGMLMEEASQEFLEAYKNADLVISKGQGNLEGLLDIEEDIYFLLKAKCEIIAEVLGVELNDFVFLYR